jgi:hypothetical protein
MSWANPAINALRTAGYKVGSLKIPLKIVHEYAGVEPSDYPDLYTEGMFVVVKEDLKTLETIPLTSGVFFEYCEEEPVTFQATLNLPRGVESPFLSGGNFSVYADNTVEVDKDSTTVEALNVVLNAGYAIRGADASRVSVEPPGR